MYHIKEMVSTIVRHLQSAIQNGVLWIFGCGVFSQICTFLSSIFVIRQLEKVDYGNYVDASNIFSYTVAFFGMGLTSAILQYCSENREVSEKNGIFRYSRLKGTVFNCCIVVVVLCISVARIVTGHRNPGIYLCLMSLQPFVVYFNSYNQIILRVKKKNKEYGIVHILFSLSVVVGNILFTRIWGVMGLVISNYFANVVAALAGRYYLKSFSFYEELKNTASPLKDDTRREIDKYALLCAVTNFSSSILVLIDITVLNVVLSDAEVLADYRVGSVIPSACMFVPSSLITFFYPELVSKIGAGKRSFIVYFKKLLVVFLVINGFVGVVLFFGSSVFIETIYGAKYLSAVGIMRILSFNYIVSASFRRLFGNAIAALKQTHVNLILSIVSGIFNILLDVIFVHHYGSHGAATATLIISCFISILEVAYIYSYLKRMPNR